MQRQLLAYFFFLLLITGATQIQHHIITPDLDGTNSSTPSATAGIENDQRLVFLLQYLASDYDRAVAAGQILDTLEYREMQRFARQIVTLYAAAPNQQETTAQQLRALEDGVAQKAPLPNIRKICAVAVAQVVKEKGLALFPHVAPDLADGETLFRENCVTCHGERGDGTGAAADTLNPKPRDFTAPERLNICSPLQFYQAITFGVDGTAMASFAEAFTPEQRWNLAFYLMTLRRDFQPLAATGAPPLTLRQLATKNNSELAEIFAYQQRTRQPDAAWQPQRFVDFCRQNPPDLSMGESIALAEKKLQQSFAAFVRADSAAAIQLAEEAYWLGFEPIESKLLSRVYLQFERLHTEYHWCLEENGPHEKAQALVRELLKILQDIRGQRGLRQ